MVRATAEDTHTLTMYVEGGAYVHTHTLISPELSRERNHKPLNILCQLKFFFLTSKTMLVLINNLTWHLKKMIWAQWQVTRLWCVSARGVRVKWLYADRQYFSSRSTPCDNFDCFCMFSERRTSSSRPEEAGNMTNFKRSLFISGRVFGNQFFFLVSRCHTSCFIRW